MVRLIATLLMLIFPAYTMASGKKPATIDCVIDAANQYEVPANILLAIASIENGKNGQFVKNSNGSYDLGHFQINTIHFKPRGVFHGKPGLNPRTAAEYGCYNAQLAAFLLRRALKSTVSKDYWTRAAAYHSATPKYNAIYKRKLITLSTQWGDWLKGRYNNSLAISYQKANQ